MIRKIAVASALCVALGSAVGCTTSQKTLAGAGIGAGAGVLAGDAIAGTGGAIVGGVGGAVAGGAIGRNL